MAQGVELAADAQELQQKLSNSHIYPESKFHEVFLSHAGKQKPFVLDLNKDFVEWPRCPRIEPFFDQSERSLPKAEEFPALIFEAARKCVVAVVILTTEYVTSKWPMLELLTFVEAQKTTNPGLKLLPVFFDVDLLASNIDDSWKAGWEKMEAKYSSDASSVVRERITISVESCIEALHTLRKTCGIVSTNNKSLQSLRQEILKAALNFLPSTSMIDPENVQGCHRLCMSISKMFQEGNEKNQRVQCLGLYGMGGLGKTTMCKALCNYFGPDFNHKVCHVEIESNDTDQNKKIDRNKKKFKRHIQILQRLSDLSEAAIASMATYTCDASHQAEKAVQQCLSKQRVFLAVDNVQGSLASHQEAENYLKWLSPESKIIITSRSRDIVLSVIGNPIYCMPLPYLEEKEAQTLFLKIAAPDQVNHPNSKKSWILREWMQICFFSLNGKTSFVKGGGPDTNKATGHYHPLALQAVASYLKDEYPGPDSILCWKKALKRKGVIFHTDESKRIFEVLGIGFENMDPLEKQIFIDVALFAPQPAEPKDIFNWLIGIHDCDADLVQVELKLLRKKSYLDYKEEGASCLNISMHELYRELAKRYLAVYHHQNDGFSKYGVYESREHGRVVQAASTHVSDLSSSDVYDDNDLAPNSLTIKDWKTVPRVHLHLQRLTNAAKMKEWESVVVVQLICCETISTFSIGELVSLRHLKIASCPKLEVLSWTQGNVKEEHGGTSKLRIIELQRNKNLRILPDFSTCSELQRVYIVNCSSTMEPLKLHTCLNLQMLDLIGDDIVLEVQSLQSCSKLRDIRMAWKASHKGSPLLETLSSLTNLTIQGSSLDSIRFNTVGDWFLQGQGNQFWRNLQHLEGSIRYDLSRFGVLKNLNQVKLTCIPLGKVPVELATIGPRLRNLCLDGCLLSQTADFNAFTYLRYLSMTWTNVEEICGLDRLKGLEYLDCSHCFKLQKVPDLRPLLKLEWVWFAHCANLQGIPRLPPGCICGESEDEWRAVLAMMAYANTVAKPFPRPQFSIGSKGTLELSRGDILWLTRGDKPNGHIPVHFQVPCDGCMMYPIIGSRYKAKPVQTKYDLCSICFSNKCNRNRCSATKSMKPRWTAVGEWKISYNLCHSCFKESGCDAGDFSCIYATTPPKGPSPKLVFILKENSTSRIVELNYKDSSDSTDDTRLSRNDWENFTFKKHNKVQTIPAHSSSCLKFHNIKMEATT